MQKKTSFNASKSINYAKNIFSTGAFFLEFSCIISGKKLGNNRKECH